MTLGNAAQCSLEYRGLRGNEDGGNTAVTEVNGSTVGTGLCRTGLRGDAANAEPQ